MILSEHARDAMAMKDGIYCAKCNVEMHVGLLPRYEYEEGIPLHNVRSYLCPKCGKFIFTEEQAHDMRARTDEAKEYMFGFERKVSLSGTSLVVGIPAELASHLRIKQGQKVRIIPVAKEGFMVTPA